MKTKLLSLLALPVFLGACETFDTAQIPQTPPPVQLANRDTVWGEMPTYDRKDQFFVIGPLPNLKNFPTDGTASGTVTVDLLVNRDGTVKDAVVTGSCGDPKVDRAAMDLYRNARYTLRLGDTDHAPYVVNQTINLKMVVHRSEVSPTSIDYGRDYYYGPTYTEWN